MAFRDFVVGAAAGSGVSLATCLVLLQRYLNHELKTPDLIHAPLEDRELLEDRHLLQEVKLLLREYWPHPFLELNGYTSTLWSGIWAALPATISPGEVNAITLKDGGTISLHWGEAPVGFTSSKYNIALVLPGLNNDSRTGFIQDTMRHLQTGGIQGVTLNYRGTGGLDLTSPRLGCADSWRDLPEVVEYLTLAHPDANLFAVGFSLGAAMLLRYLGEEGSRSPFKAAVAIAAPVDLEATADDLDSSLGKSLLSRAMAFGAKLNLRHSLLRSRFANLVSKEAILRARSLRELDQATICPLHGYCLARDYYCSNNPRQTLFRIVVPTLVINAADDPICSTNVLPIEDIRRNPRLYLTITRRGGHIGWGTGGLGAAAWTDNMAVDFIQACILRSRL